VRHIYDATINSEKLTLSCRDMRAAHKAVMREVKKRIADPKEKTTVSIVRRGSEYQPHEETM